MRRKRRGRRSETRGKRERKERKRERKGRSKIEEGQSKGTMRQDSHAHSSRILIHYSSNCARG